MDITIWNENIGETQGNPDILGVHPEGIHGTLREIVLEIGPDIRARTATLQQEQAGLDDAVLAATDVLLWWERDHAAVPDEVASRIAARVRDGMGLVLLHSAHGSKLVRQLLGTSGELKFVQDCYMRLVSITPAHPIACGVPDTVDLGVEECYVEHFDVPAPEEVVFISTTLRRMGNVFRAGCTWRCGAGRLFYFQPGHETSRVFYNPHVRRIIKNACRWAGEKE